MRKISILLVYLAYSCSLFAQKVGPGELKILTQRKITVVGHAEAEVVPDIIYFNISLTEYTSGREKISIDQLERQLQKALSEATVTQKDLSIINISGHNYHAYNKTRGLHFQTSKQYLIKVNDLKKVDAILKKIDLKGVESTHVHYGHSKTHEVENELKLKALTMAKNKASYILNRTGEKVGEVLEIEEIVNSDYDRYSGYPYASGRSIETSIRNDDLKDPSVIPTKKIHFRMKVTFAIDR